MANYQMAAPATFQQGSTVSNAVNVFGNTIVGFEVPVGFIGSSITFTAAIGPNDDFRPVIDPTTGSAVSVIITADRYVLIPPSSLAGLQYFRIIASPQTDPSEAARTINVIARPVN